MSRHAQDYYPTPPDVVEALRLWLVEHAPWTVGEPWLDPAAGQGALLRFLGVDRADAYAFDIMDTGLCAFAARAYVGDALSVSWPAANVVCNPPFSHAAQFVARCGRGDAVSCVLTRTAMWQTAAAAVLPEPGALLLLRWRPSFTGDGQTDYATYAWAVYGTGHRGQHWFVDRPAVSGESWDLWRTMTGQPAVTQVGLDL